MTVMAFLDRLYESPRTWRLERVGRDTWIRNDQDDCPITVATGKHWMDVDNHFLEGIGRVPTDQVVGAADGAAGHNPKIRRALLDACGLKGNR